MGLCELAATGGDDCKTSRRPLRPAAVLAKPRFDIDRVISNVTTDAISRWASSLVAPCVERRYGNSEMLG